MATRYGRNGTGTPCIWSDSYIITTISENNPTRVKEYIQKQQKK